jgi:dCTP diphosphatase
LSEKTIFQNSLQSYQNKSTITTTNTMTKTATLENLLSRIEEFRAERNWQQYHSPKNLAMALSVECSELLEIFQWLTPAQSFDPDQATRSHIEEEIGDVMIYLSLLSSTFDINPIEAALEKMKANEKKYPAPPESD